MFPMYESLVGSDRPKLLRQLGWCIIFMVASCWLFIGIASADRTEAWRAEFFSHAGSGLWAFAVSAVWIVTGLLLVMRLPWAWWLACVVLSGFLAYACFGFYPFITSMVFFLIWIFITLFFASAPAISSYQKRCSKTWIRWLSLSAYAGKISPCGNWWSKPRRANWTML